jgi:hypothetical protein
MKLVLGSLLFLTLSVFYANAAAITTEHEKILNLIQAALSYLPTQLQQFVNSLNLSSILNQVFTLLGKRDAKGLFDLVETIVNQFLSTVNLNALISSFLPGVTGLVSTLGRRDLSTLIGAVLGFASNLFGINLTSLIPVVTGIVSSIGKRDITGIEIIDNLILSLVYQVVDLAVSSVFNFVTGIFGKRDLSSILNVIVTAVDNFFNVNLSSIVPLVTGVVNLFGKRQFDSGLAQIIVGGVVGYITDLIYTGFNNIISYFGPRSILGSIVVGVATSLATNFIVNTFGKRSVVGDLFNQLIEETIEWGINAITSLVTTGITSLFGKREVIAGLVDQLIDDLVQWGIDQITSLVTSGVNAVLGFFGKRNTDLIYTVIQLLVAQLGLGKRQIPGF